MTDEYVFGLSSVELKQQVAAGTVMFDTYNDVGSPRNHSGYCILPDGATSCKIGKITGKTSGVMALTNYEFLAGYERKPSYRKPHQNPKETLHLSLS